MSLCNGVAGLEAACPTHPPQHWCVPVYTNVWQRCATGSFSGVSVFVRENAGVAAYLCVFVCLSRVCSYVHVSESKKGQAGMCVFLRAQILEEKAWG